MESKIDRHQSNDFAFVFRNSKVLEYKTIEFNGYFTVMLKRAERPETNTLSSITDDFKL